MEKCQEWQCNFPLSCRDLGVCIYQMAPSRNASGLWQRESVQSLAERRHFGINKRYLTSLLGNKICVMAAAVGHELRLCSGVTLVGWHQGNKGTYSWGLPAGDPQGSLMYFQFSSRKYCRYASCRENQVPCIWRFPPSNNTNITLVFSLTVSPHCSPLHGKSGGFWAVPAYSTLKGQLKRQPWLQLLPGNPEAVVFLISSVASQLESTVTYE